MPTLPDLPGDPETLRSAWITLSFLIALTGFLVGTITVLLRTKKLIENVVAEESRSIVQRLEQIEATTDTQLTSLNQSNADIARSLHALSAQGQVNQERTRTLEGRVDHLDERTERIAEGVAHLEGRLDREKRGGSNRHVE